MSLKSLTQSTHAKVAQAGPRPPPAGGTPWLEISMPIWHGPGFACVQAACHRLEPGVNMARGPHMWWSGCEHSTHDYSTDDEHTCKNQANCTRVFCPIGRVKCPSPRDVNDYAHLDYTLTTLRGQMPDSVRAECPILTWQGVLSC